MRMAMAQSLAATGPAGPAPATPAARASSSSSTQPRQAGAALVEGRVVGEDEALAEAMRQSLQAATPAQPRPPSGGGGGGNGNGNGNGGGGGNGGGNVQERLSAAAGRLAAHPAALDMLLSILQMVLDNPAEPK